MNLTLPSRRVLLTVGGLLLVLALWIALPFFSASRGIERTWDKFLSAVEDNDMTALGRILGDDYADGFGQNRAECLKLAASVRKQFVVCTVRREHSELVLDPSNKSAVTRAFIRLGGQGPGAEVIIQAANSSQTPTAFRWRRNSWKPWDWRLVSIDNPDAARALTQFRRDIGSIGLTP